MICFFLFVWFANAGCGVVSRRLRRCQSQAAGFLEEGWASGKEEGESSINPYSNNPYSLIQHHRYLIGFVLTLVLKSGSLSNFSPITWLKMSMVYCSL